MASTTNLKTRFEAGRAGPDVRSDLRVTFEPRPAGGVEVELQSRVAPYYGDNIRAQAQEVLAELGVHHARIAIQDEGALPFVIAARIEAAVRRAGLGQGRRALPQPVPLPPPSSRDRLRRSRLYLPGSEPKYFINAGLHAPDAIILDLEDAVHPAEKDTARILVRNALRAVDFAAVERMVRINQLPLGYEDLDEVVPEAPDVVLIPKVEHAEQVLAVGERVVQIAARCEIERPIWLMSIMESALGIENAFAIASASERMVAMSIGLEDYTADLGVVKSADGRESLYARTRLVNAAHAAHIQASDSVYSDVGDMEGLGRWAESARALGFEGMGCVHPLQIPVIHQAFAPSPAEIEKALKVVAAFEEAQQRGLGVVSLGSKMIDPPVVLRALKLVERARQMGLLPATEPSTANSLDTT
ncbi:MAG TPA: aldolase/citrate lyase family protein [Terriglobales bacterium]|nr:aldolase/citrate lyase family protein [Terriglobales bacterium]